MIHISFDAEMHERDVESDNCFFREASLIILIRCLESMSSVPAVLQMLSTREAAKCLPFTLTMHTVTTAVRGNTYLVSKP